MSSNRKNADKKIVQKKYSIQAFLSKNAGPGKMVRNLSGSLYTSSAVRAVDLILPYCQFPFCIFTQLY